MSEENLPAKQQPDEMAQFLGAMLPIATKFLQNQAVEIEQNRRIAEKELDAQSQRDASEHELEKEHIKLDQFKFTRFFLLLAGVLVFIGALVWGIIFYLGKVELGIGLLTHIGVLMLGLLSGMGIERFRSSPAADSAGDS